MSTTSDRSEFQRTLLSATLPKYRLDSFRNIGWPETFDRPLLHDVLYDTLPEARAEVAAGCDVDDDHDYNDDVGEQNNNNRLSRSSRRSKKAIDTNKKSNNGGRSSGGTGAGGGGGDLAAWRCQIRAIFFPQAHILAQQQAKKGETVRVLDQSTEWFELLSLFLTVVNIVAVAFDDPTMPETASQKIALDKLDTFFSLFYFFEMVIRVISFGVREFWADEFNRLDAVVVVFGLVSLALKLTSSSLANVTFVRALRVLRPLRTMTQFKQTRLTVASVIGSFRELLDVWVLFMVFFSVLSVLATDPFRGLLRNNCVLNAYFTSFSNLPPLSSDSDNATTSNNNNNHNNNNNNNNTAYTNAIAALKLDLREAYDPNGLFVQYVTRQEWQEFIYNTTLKYPAISDYVCYGPVDKALGLTQTHSAVCEDRLCTQDAPPEPGQGRDCPTGYQCAKSVNPQFGFLGFDNILLSALTTFVLLTTSFWVDVYHMMYDSSNAVAAAYCVFTVIVGRYFVVSIIIAIVTDRFREKHRQQQLILHEQQLAAARASKRIRVKSIVERSLEALERYFGRLRNLEEIEVRHDFASSLEEDVLVSRTNRDWDKFRFVDEDLYDTQASMIRRSASMAAAAATDFGESAQQQEQEQEQEQQQAQRNTKKQKDSFATSKKLNTNEGNKQKVFDDISTSGNDNSNSHNSSNNNNNSSSGLQQAAVAVNHFRHFALDRDARRRRWFAREIVLQKWFLVLRVVFSILTLVYLGTEYEGLEKSESLVRMRFYGALAIMCWWMVELLLRSLSRRWLLLLTDLYFVVEVVCVLFLFLSLMSNVGAKFGSLSEAFFLGRFSVFLSESHRVTPLYRWIRIIVAAFRSSVVLIVIIVGALFLLACTGMQVFGARWCGLHAPKSLEENIKEINAGTCVRPKANFDSLSGAMVAAFQVLTGDSWEALMYYAMQSTWGSSSTTQSVGGFFITGIVAMCFVAAFVILNYLFANLFISILLNSRAVNEEELRRDAIRIQREVHYGKLLARRQLQLEAGLYDVAAVASALFSFNSYFRGMKSHSRKVFDVLFSDKVAGRLARWRRHHVFASLHVAAVTLCAVGLALAKPITAPDTTSHRAGLALIHVSTTAFAIRLVCEIWIESYKMRLRKLHKRQRGVDDIFDFGDGSANTGEQNDGDDDEDHDDDEADDAGQGNEKRSKKNDDDDGPLRERYAIASYLTKSNWHVFELVLTICGIVFGGLRLFLQTYSLGVFAMSCVLCFRPLCYMERAVGLQSVLRDIGHMLRNLACILSLIVVFYIFYSLLGVQLLRGQMSVCLSNRTIGEAVNCTTSGNVWGPVPFNFDDLGAATYTLYAVATLSDWTEILYQAQDAATGSSFFTFLVNAYFLAFIIAGGLFAQSLITMMLIDTFEVRRLGGTEKASKQDQARAVTEERLSVQQKLVARIVPREVAEMRQRALSQRIGIGIGTERGGGGNIEPSAAASLQGALNEAASSKQQQPQRSLGQRGLTMTQSKGFRFVVATMVFLSFGVSASYRYPMSDFWAELNYWADLAFTVLFVLELILYLILQALCVDVPKGVDKWYKRLPLRAWNGWRVHFSSKWNWFDAVIVLLSVVGIVLERTAERWAWTKNLRALRALRLLRLVKNNPRIAEMVSRLGSAIKQLVHVTIIFLVFFISFGLLGIRLFGHVKYNGYLISDRVGFSDFVSSVMMMMRIATLNRWPATMVALSVQSPDCDPNIGECGNRAVSRTFMISTTIIFGFVLSNMFVAVLVDAYMSKRLEGQLLSQVALTAKEIKDFADKFVTWPTMDPVFFTIPAEHVVPFLRSLRRLHLEPSAVSSSPSGAAASSSNDIDADVEAAAAAASADPRNSRIHPFALPVCELRWRQPQWDLLAVQQLNLREYSPGLIDYWSLIHALCDLRFVRDVSSRNPQTGAVSTVKAGVLEKSKEKMLKRKFLLKVPARQQQLYESKKKRFKKRNVVDGDDGDGDEDDELEDNADEDDEELNPQSDWDNPFETQPRMLLEVYAITRLRNILVTMPKWRGFLMEAAGGGNGDDAADGGRAGGAPVGESASVGRSARNSTGRVGASFMVKNSDPNLSAVGNGGLVENDSPGLFEDSSMIVLDY